MKMLSNILFKKIHFREMESLTGQVDETLDSILQPPVKKTFTAAQLWNLQRQKKQFIQRRYAY